MGRSLDRRILRGLLKFARGGDICIGESFLTGRRAENDCSRYEVSKEESLLCRVARADSWVSFDAACANCPVPLADDCCCLLSEGDTAGSGLGDLDKAVSYIA